MADWYLWVKSVHIIAIISWMAGLLYLPRLYVYHVQAEKGGELDETLKIMERKLLRFIMNPAMIVVIVTGLALVHISQAHLSGWFHTKVLLLIGLFASHGIMSKFRKAFERGDNLKSQKFFRWFNEIPTLLMIAIVILAVVKPF